MNYPAALFGFVSLACVSLLSAADVAVDDTADDDSDGHHRRTFHLSAKCGRDEVLVVHATRWEDGRKVLEIEEVVVPAEGTAAYVIEFTQPAAEYWRVTEPGAEQHLQGVRLGRLHRTVALLDVELVPVPGGAKRTYRFMWEAHVETRRPAARGGSRRILYPMDGRSP